tara:strand:+ start:837 stop:1067 length:231 start_codon:yes stop_codon:yes gene_type:complete
MNTYSAKYISGDIRDLETENFKIYTDEVKGASLNDVSQAIIKVCRNTTAKPWDFVITKPDGKKIRPSKERMEKAWS